jgi:uncharacterized membrane protein
MNWGWIMIEIVFIGITFFAFLILKALINGDGHEVGGDFGELISWGIAIFILCVVIAFWYFACTKHILPIILKMIWNSYPFFR